MSAYVYRVYDADDRLIYVGATKLMPYDRMRQHRSKAWWAPQVARVKATVYSTYFEARVAERAAIYTENPRWNVLGRGNFAGKTNAEVRDYITALRSGPSAHLLTVQRSIENAERVLANRRREVSA